MISIAEVVVTRPDVGQAIVALIGEHDLDSKTALAEVLGSLIKENELVVVDLTDAEFIDSCVLHNLVVADRLARERGTRFRVQLGNENVNKVLRISGLLEHLDCVSNRQDALDAATEEGGPRTPRP